MLTPSRLALIFLIALSITASAYAAPQTFCLQGVTFNDGGTASGCFNYDPTTNLYSNVSISTTTGTVRTGAFYSFVCGQSNPTCTGLPASSSSVLYVTSSAANLTGTPGFALVFATPLTTGGTATLAVAQEATCVDATCSAPTRPQRFAGAGAAVAQNVFLVRYASNLAIGDSVIDFTNTGAGSTTAFPTQNGNICVNAYTFSPDEQLISCCSCPVTPNGLASLSVRNDLISNTLTPGVPTSVVIKLLASAGPTCNAAAVGTGTNTLSPGLAAFGTTLHALPVTPGSPATTFAVTETPFTPSILSAAEANRIISLCGFIQTNGSGFGVCKSCRLGGLGAAANTN